MKTTYLLFSIGPVVVYSLYMLWAFYLAYASLNRARKAGKLSPMVQFLGYGIVVPGAVLDFIIQIVATIPFFDLPREWTFSTRLSRYWDGSDKWRSKVAGYIATNFLNNFEEGHIK